VFLRSALVKSGGKLVRYWKLVENYGTARGTRQRVVAHLGRLENFTAQDWQDLADRMGQPEMAAALEYRVKNVRRGRPCDRVAPLSPEEAAEQVLPIRLGDVGWKDPRRFGDVYAALHFWRLLGLGRLVSGALKGRSAALTSEVAALMVANRLVSPESEWGMLEWWPRTALPELLGLPVERVDDTRLYRCLDALLPMKAQIEEHLAGTGRDLFGREYTALLYDLTSTYFAGPALGVPDAKLGHSRDKRKGCKQLCIGMVVDWEGFPAGYEVHAGNTHDAATVPQTLAKLRARFPDGEPTVCMDRGMVNDETMSLLRKGWRFIVAERREAAGEHLGMMSEAAWQVMRRDAQGQTTLEVQELPPEGGERLILVRSAGCARKERGIHDRMFTRLVADLNRLEGRVAAGRLKDRAKIERALGRIMERSPGISRWVQAGVETGGSTPVLRWQVLSEVMAEKQAQEGLYVLRTNLQQGDPEQIWSQYMTLARIEAAFRHLKQELRLRPLFHKKQHRVEAHILLSYLAYVLLWVMEHTHRCHGGTLTGRGILEVLSGIEMGTITLRAGDGRRLQLQRLSAPRPEEAHVLASLDMALPRVRGAEPRPDWQMSLIDFGDKNGPPQGHSDLNAPGKLRKMGSQP